jgi:hypothetical protein
VGHVGVSSPGRATGTSALLHLVALIFAALVPILMLINALSTPGDSRSAWRLYDRVDIIVLIFCVLAVLLILTSMFIQRRLLLVAAAGLLFASFGMLLPFPLESAAQSNRISIEIGTWVSLLAALVAAGAAVFASERVGDVPAD